jgi:hypothetical protein
MKTLEWNSRMKAMKAIRKVETRSLILLERYVQIKCYSQQHFRGVNEYFHDSWMLLASIGLTGKMVLISLAKRLVVSSEKIPVAEEDFISKKRYGGGLNRAAAPVHFYANLRYIIIGR